MTNKELAETVAYCGLACGLCGNTSKGCKGCSSNGGAADCHQRACCLEKGFDGCWQCEHFPCDKGFYADDAWKGLCIASVQCVKDNGLQAYVDLLTSRLGTDVDYGDYRFKDAEEIRTIFCGDSGK